MAKASLGFIGAGRIGGGLAKLAVGQGHPVVISNSRGPESLADEVAKIGPLCKAGTVDDAVKCDLVVVSVPLKAMKKAVPGDKLNGKVVIDTNNYYPDRDGKIPELDNKSTTSSEMLAAHAKGAKVVKAFGTIASFQLDDGKPKGAADRRALPIAGDDAGAKKTVSDLIDSFGFDTVDLGPLREGKWFQPVPITNILVGYFLPASWSKKILGYVPVYGPNLTAEQLTHALKENGWKPSA